MLKASSSDPREDRLFTFLWARSLAAATSASAKQEILLSQSYVDKIPAKFLTKLHAEGKCTPNHIHTETIRIRQALERQVQHVAMPVFALLYQTSNLSAWLKAVLKKITIT